MVHDTVDGKKFTACLHLVRAYGDLVSYVESLWEAEAVTAMQNRSLRVWCPGMPTESASRRGDAQTVLAIGLGRDHFRTSGARANKAPIGQASQHNSP